MALVLVLLTGAAMAQSGAQEMGPAAFMWPPDRVWSAVADNTAPCGSIAGVSNRTQFPMQNGRVALVAQNESWDAVLSISYLQDPRTDSDFTTLIDAEAMREVDRGHTCVNVADPPSSVRPNSNATLQVRYLSAFDRPENETFYACADITYVALSDFTERIPCFNATRPRTGSGSATAAPSAGGSGRRLSGGAIAGIVVGAVVGAALLAAGALLFYRQRQRQIRLLQQQNSARAAKWTEAPDQPRASNSNGSVRMQNLSH